MFTLLWEMSALWWGMKVPYNKLSVSLNFANWARTVLINKLSTWIINDF